MSIQRIGLFGWWEVRSCDLYKSVWRCSWTLIKCTNLIQNFRSQHMSNPKPIYMFRGVSHKCLRVWNICGAQAVGRRNDRQWAEWGQVGVGNCCTTWVFTFCIVDGLILQALRVGYGRCWRWRNGVRPENRGALSGQWMDNKAELMLDWVIASIGLSIRPLSYFWWISLSAVGNACSSLEFYFGFLLHSLIFSNIPNF